MGNPTTKLLVITRIDDGCIYILRLLDLKKHSLATMFLVPNQQWIYNPHLLFSWVLFPWRALLG